MMSEQASPASCPSGHRAPATHPGFTLIELLVVIAIIAVLAAILFPVFAKAREKARQTNCMNNQRQIATSILMYAQDHDETYPESATIWQDINVERGVLVCPTKGKKQTVGYSYNSFVAGRAIGDTFEDPDGIMPKDVMESLCAFLTMDGKGTNENTFVTHRDIDGERHSGKYVASFTDGHVELRDALPPMLSANLLAGDIDPTMNGGSPFIVTTSNGPVGPTQVTLKDNNKAYLIGDTSSGGTANQGSSFTIRLDANKKLTKRFNEVYNMSKGKTVEFIWAYKLERQATSSDLVSCDNTIEIGNHDNGVNIPRFYVTAPNLYAGKFSTITVPAMRNDESAGQEVAEMVSSADIPNLRFKVAGNGGARTATQVDVRWSIRVEAAATQEAQAIDDVAIYEIVQ